MNDFVKKVQRVTAKAVIFDNNKYLLVREPDNRWEFPGGKIEFGDTPEETLKRELQEELGLNEDLTIGKVLNPWTWIFKFEKVHLQFFMLPYLCETPQKEFKLSAEHIDYGWFDKEEALKLNLTEGTRGVIEKV